METHPGKIIVKSYVDKLKNELLDDKNNNLSYQKLNPEISFSNFSTKIYDPDFNKYYGRTLYHIGNHLYGCHYIKNIILEIELNDFFDNLTLIEKQDLLETTIKLYFDLTTDTYNEISIISCLFYNFCNNRSIEYSNNTVQFNIIDYSLYKTSHELIYGLPINYCNNLDILIETKLKYKMNLIINGVHLHIEKSNQLKEHHTNYNLYFFQNKSYGLERLASSIIDDFKYVVHLPFHHLAKYIMFYVLHDEANILNVKLYCGGVLYKNCNTDQLLTFKIFNRKMYILPLSDDFSSINQISKSLNDLNNVTSQVVDFGSTTLNIIVFESDIDLSNHEIYIEEFAINILKLTEKSIHFIY